MLLHARGKEETKIDIDVAHMIRDFTRLAVKGTKSKAVEMKTEVVVELQRDLPPLIVSAQGLSRVIINLVTNACYEAHESAVAADNARDPKVLVNASYDEDRAELEIRVEDTGRGVPVEQREKIFEPFFTTKSPNEGTGLGLSICRDIVAQSEGKLFYRGVWVRRCRLRSTDSSRYRRQFKKHPVANMTVTEDISPTILFVDDEPDLQVLLRQRFRRQIKKGELSF